MHTDVSGRVRNVTLSASKPLLPLFEAIVNSLQAIEDVGEPQGRVNVSIVRDDHQQSLLQDTSHRDVTGFVIEDNGIGFTPENFCAFETADTRYKAHRGGKGIGRFMWLVAFDQVEVESHYKDEDGMKCRTFSFVAEGDGIADHDTIPSERMERSTIVRLIDYKAKYTRRCPKRLDTIASYIVEHFLEYFIRPDCPEIWLNEGDNSGTIKLNDFFESQMATSSQSVRFNVDTFDFDILHVRLKSTHIKDHLVHFCADSRVVKTQKLSGRIPDLAKRLQDENGQDFVYAAYVEAEALNTTVNSERTDFSIEEEATSLFPTDITWKKIREALSEQCKQYLSPYTEPVRKQKQERIERFIETDAPMYRPIMKHIGERLGAFDPEISDSDLELKLYEAYNDLQVELKTVGTTLLEATSETDNEFEEYERRFEDYFRKLNDVKAADLARYVFHRKLVLQFFQKVLAIQDDRKYRREDRIHNVMFPRGKTSEDVLFEEHNLWLIDEKLAYHAFLASDKQLRTIPPLETDSQKKPDIVIFNKACVFVAASEPPYPSVVIIEFKRPMRSNYNDEKNPFVQIREYINDITSGKARTPDGRDIPVQSGVPFYCYIVCDIDDRLEQLAYDFELTKTPDGQGFFGYKRQYDAYYEVVSYTKMAADAKKRNQIFFDKLGLPSRIGEQWPIKRQNSN
jgi:hypothetical protein